VIGQHSPSQASLEMQAQRPRANTTQLSKIVHVVAVLGRWNVTILLVAYYLYAAVVKVMLMIMMVVNLEMMTLIILM
jgi:hypothetical protein